MECVLVHKILIKPYTDTKPTYKDFSMKHILCTYFSNNHYKNTLPKFIKTGLAVIATLLLTAIITDKVTGGAVNAALKSNAVFTSVSSVFKEKKLPIYCVKTDKKQIALTFDGAWGDGYRHLLLHRRLDFQIS